MRTSPAPALFLLLLLQIFAVGCKAGLGADAAVSPHRTLSHHLKDTAGDPCTSIQAPSNVECRQREDGSLEVTWAPPKSSSCVTKYRVVSSAEIYASGDILSKSTEVFASNLTHQVMYPVPYSSYTFDVRAVAADGRLGVPGSCGITVEGEVPSEPVNLRVTAKTHASLSIAWKAPVNANGGHLEYHIRYNAPGGEVMLIDTPQVSHSIGGLESCTKYTITVSASNDVGEGNPAQTEGATDFDAPEAVKCSQARSDLSLKVRWVPPKESCTIARFDVSHKTSVLWSQESYSNATSVDGSQTIYVIEYPESFSFYYFEVKAADDGVMVGDPANCSILTAETAPSNPQSLSLLEATSQTLTIEWEQPAQLNGILRSFLVTWTSDVPGDDGTEVIPAQQTDARYNYMIPDLSAGTIYDVQVQAITSYTGEAAHASFQTLDGDPLGPEQTTGQTEITETTPTVTTVTTQPADKGTSNSLSTGALVGIVVGSVFGIALLVFVAMKCLKPKSIPRRTQPSREVPVQASLRSNTLDILSVRIPTSTSKGNSRN